MDTFFGIGFGEIAVILIFALFFLGPGRMVDFARAMNRLINNLKIASSNIKAQLEKEVDEQKKPLTQNIDKFNTEFSNQTKSVSQIGKEFISDLKCDVNDISNTANEFAGEIKEQKRVISDSIKQPCIENVEKPNKSINITKQTNKNRDIGEDADTKRVIEPTTSSVPG